MHRLGAKAEDGCLREEGRQHCLVGRNESTEVADCRAAGHWAHSCTAHAGNEPGLGLSNMRIGTGKGSEEGLGEDFLG